MGMQGAGEAGEEAANGKGQYLVSYGVDSRGTGGNLVLADSMENQARPDILAAGIGELPHYQHRHGHDDNNYVVFTHR